MAIVTELVNRISFTGDMQPLDDLVDGIDDFVKDSVAFIAAVAASALAVVALTKAILEDVDAMGQLHRNTDIAVKDMQELGFAASVTGSSAEAVMSTLESLTTTIGDAALRGNDDLNRLGISVRKVGGETKTAVELLENIRERFVGKSKQEKLSYAASLGIDSSLIQLLSQSSGKMDELRAKAHALGVVTGEDAEAAIAFNDSLTTLKFGLSAIQREVALALAPEIKQLADYFVDLLIVNKDLIGEGLQTTFTWIGNVTSALKNFGIGIDTFIEKTVGWQIALGVIGVALAWTFLPINLTIAGIGLLILAVDDLVTAFDGGKSVIGDFFDGIFDDLDLGLLVFETFIGDIVDAFDIGMTDIVNTLLDMESRFKGSSLGEFLKFLMNPGEFAGEKLGRLLMDRAFPQKEAPSVGATGTIIQDIKVNISGTEGRTIGEQVVGSLQKGISTAASMLGISGK